MAPIAETCSWECGPYRVQERPRPDNPAFPAYLVFRGDKFIGKSFSRPDVGACQWLERQVYADSSAQLKQHSVTSAGGIARNARLARS